MQNTDISCRSCAMHGSGHNGCREPQDPWMDYFSISSAFSRCKPAWGSWSWPYAHRLEGSPGHAKQPIKGEKHEPDCSAGSDYLAPQPRALGSTHGVAAFGYAPLYDLPYRIHPAQSIDGNPVVTDAGTRRQGRYQPLCFPDNSPCLHHWYRQYHRRGNCHCPGRSGCGILVLDGRYFRYGYQVCRSADCRPFPGEKR